MRFPAPRIAHCIAIVMIGGVSFSRGAEDPEGEKKPSLVRRLFGGGEKEKKDEATKPALEPKKPEKPKESATAKKSPPTDANKPSGKPKSKIVLTPSGDGTPPSKPKPKPEPEKKSVAKKPDSSDSKEGSKTPKDRDLGSEFGKGSEDSANKSSMSLNDKFKPSNESPAPSASSPPNAVSDANVVLPPIDSSFEVVKYDGRDYVTAESIHKFYRFSSYKVDGNNVILSNPTLILKASVGSQDILMNNIKFILSYPFASVGGKPAFSRLDLCKLIDPVLLPSHIGDADAFDTIVVDAGHGGHDSGARGVYGFEKDFTLQMAFAVKAALVQRGFKVVMTRSTDEFISLGGRAEIANKTPHSIFLSLHFNSSGPAANGIETFALSPQGTASTFMGQRSSDYHAFSGNHQDSANIALATAVHAMVIHRFKLADRGIKRARWSVLTGCNRPGILFEGGFVTNGTECRLIASTTYREAVANAIGDAIVNYRRALQPRVAQPSSKSR